MHRKFADVFASYGLQIDKNTAYGFIHGYETNVLVNPMDKNYPLRMHVSFFATDEQKANIDAAIKSMSLKFFTMSFTAYGLSFGFGYLPSADL